MIKAFLIEINDLKKYLSQGNFFYVCMSIKIMSKLTILSVTH